jgi:hypothetical protein
LTEPDFRLSAHAFDRARALRRFYLAVWVFDARRHVLRLLVRTNDIQSEYAPAKKV